VARPLADFLVGRSIPDPQLQGIYRIVEKDAAIEQVVSLRAVYIGPEEVVVIAKARPAPRMSIEELSQAMDDLDRRIRKAMPFVADVFIGGFVEIETIGATVSTANAYCGMEPVTP